MDGEIDADAPLDYAAFHILPRQNRYEVFVCGDQKVEKLAAGLLEQLKIHLPEVEDLNSEGLNADFRLQLPENVNVSWFTKSTLKRFLNIVGSLELFNTINAVEDEVSKLEKSRKFHLSLYAQGHRDHLGSEEADGCNSNDLAPTKEPEVKTVSSDASKNELLRAMELRLIALRGELAAALNQAAGAVCSPEQIDALIKFSQHFGVKNLKDALSKFLLVSQEKQTVDQDDKSIFTWDSRLDYLNKGGGNTPISRSLNSVVPVKYGVSPAKVAEIERQSSTEGEGSSDSTDEDGTSAERSRTLVRSASPKRSASPMRRIQIGRTGSRRAPALTIQSLSYFPASDRAFSHRSAAANSSEEEGSEQPQKKSVNNVQGISVQDAINLFESKQRDQNANIQKKISLMNTCIGANKSVLRRWSAGMVNSSIQSQPEIVSEDSVLITQDKITETENRSSVEAESKSDFKSGRHNPCETALVDLASEVRDESTSLPVDTRAETRGEGIKERLTASTEWNRQKEVELNQMLMQMTKSKPLKYKKVEGERNQNLSSERRGRSRFYGHCKEKGDQKLQGENSGKRTEKATPKATKQIVSERKDEITSRNVTDVVKRHPLHNPQNSYKRPSQHANTKRETSKPSIAKKVLSKPSTLPAIRNSWPSATLPKTTEMLPAKTPSRISSSGSTPTHRKSPPTPAITRPSPKMERSQQQRKYVKGTQTSVNRSVKGVNEKQQLTVTKGGRMTKARVLTASEDRTGMVPTKSTFYRKITRKGSVVPLESRSLPHKGSGTGPDGRSTDLKAEGSSQTEKSLRACGNGSEAELNEVAVTTSELLHLQQEMDVVALEIQDVCLESETEANNHQKCSETQNYDKLTADGDYGFENMLGCPLTVQFEEESIISPRAWVETPEHSGLPILHDDSIQLASPDNVAPEALSNPRIRQSLSQMLQEESTDHDIIEWGNAEHNPAIICQKDAPKGLKRLLKFARKSKGDATTTGLLSSSAISEGEDEVDVYTAVSKGNTEPANLPRKASLHPRNFRQHKPLLCEGKGENVVGEQIPAQSNVNNYDAQSSSYKLQGGQISPAASTTKATRSFFSLSAFRGSKPNETKFH